MGESLKARAEPSALVAHDRRSPGLAPAEQGQVVHDRRYLDPDPADRRHRGRVHPLPEAAPPAG